MQFQLGAATTLRRIDELRTKYRLLSILVCVEMNSTRHFGERPAAHAQPLVYGQLESSPIYLVKVDQSLAQSTREATSNSPIAQPRRTACSGLSGTDLGRQVGQTNHYRTHRQNIDRHRRRTNHSPTRRHLTWDRVPPGNRLHPTRRGRHESPWASHLHCWEVVQQERHLPFCKGPLRRRGGINGYKTTGALPRNRTQTKVASSILASLRGPPTFLHSASLSVARPLHHLWQFRLITSPPRGPNKEEVRDNGQLQRSGTTHQRRFARHHPRWHRSRRVPDGNRFRIQEGKRRR